MSDQTTRWQPDPYGAHEFRFFSADGKPTLLVMDGGKTSYDRPPTAARPPAPEAPSSPEPEPAAAPDIPLAPPPRAVDPDQVVTRPTVHRMQTTDAESDDSAAVRTRPLVEVAAIHGLGQ